MAWVQVILKEGIGLFYIRTVTADALSSQSHWTLKGELTGKTNFSFRENRKAENSSTEKSDLKKEREREYNKVFGLGRKYLSLEDVVVY